MNKDRRKRIEEAVSKIEDLKSEIEELLTEEQDYLDNMPESFQEGDRGQTAQSAIDNLDEAMSGLDDVINSMNSAAE